MPAAPHRIRQQRWKVFTDSAAGAFAWRKLLHDHGQDLLMPLFEKAFEEVAGADRVVHIPKLELRVRINVANQPLEDFLELIAQQLAEQLQLLQASVPPAGTSSWAETTVQKSQFDILIHYLRSGLLPWQAADASASAQANPLTETCRADWLHLLDYLRHHVESPAFYFRLLQLVSAEESISLISALSDWMPSPLKPVVGRWGALVFEDQDSPPPRYLRLRIVAELLSECRKWQECTVPPKFLSLALEALPFAQCQVWQVLISSLPEFAVVSRGQRKPDGDREADEASRAPTPESSESLHPVPVDLAGTADLRLPFGLFAPEESDFFGRQQPAEDLFPLLVHQAGLVLLHPFVPRFFENTAIIEKGSAQFSFTALARAAALLHFLATGNEEVYEFELGLIKVLLGLRPENPLPVCQGLVTPRDRDEAEALLQAAITHWSALKNTSIYGLRTSFLRRQALMREADNGWKLHVERLPFDMLLDKLPWSISIVKLPWMPRAIYTEW